MRVQQNQKAIIFYSRESAWVRVFNDWLPVAIQLTNKYLEIPLTFLGKVNTSYDFETFNKIPVRFHTIEHL